MWWLVSMVLVTVFVGGITIGIRWAESRHKTNVGTPSASHNSDYATALRVYQEYLTSDDRKLSRSFCDFLEQRLNAEKQHSA